MPLLFDGQACATSMPRFHHQLNFLSDGGRLPPHSFWGRASLLHLSTLAVQSDIIMNNQDLRNPEIPSIEAVKGFLCLPD